MADIVEVKQDNRSQKQIERLQEFTEILEKLHDLEDKKKMLWLNIYENALVDRDNAFILFSRMKQRVEELPEEHLLAGPILSKYIERMTRANDQILKLAELIQHAESAEEGLNMDDIYEKITK